MPRPRWAVGDDGAHAEIVRERERGSIVPGRVAHVAGLTARRHRAEQPKGIDLVPALLVSAGEVERLPAKPLGVVEPSDGEPHLGERDRAEQVVGHELHRAGLVGHFAQERDGVVGAIRQRVRHPSRRRDAVEGERRRSIIRSRDPPAPAATAGS